MALSTMTPEWKAAAHSMARYIIRRKQTDAAKLMIAAQNPVGLYNEWANAMGCAIHDPEIALWCIEHMKTLVNSPLDLLISAVTIDDLVS